MSQHDAAVVPTAHVTTEGLTNPDRVAVRRALISVYDKTGLVDLARALIGAGVEIISTGSTAATIAGVGGLQRGGEVDGPHGHDEGGGHRPPGEGAPGAQGLGANHVEEAHALRGARDAHRPLTAPVTRWR